MYEAFLILFLVLIFLFILIVYFFFAVEDELVLYYDLANDNITDSNSIEISAALSDTILYYSIERGFMTDANFVKNKNLISFLGIRTVSIPEKNIESLYKEEVTIKMENGDFVIGSSIYTDKGTSFKTIGVPYVEYGISSKTGIFEKYDNIIIYLDNVNNTRKVVFF
jgi:hypothetical protein